MRWLVLCVALAAIALSVWKLEADRAGLIITPLDGTGTTPATLYLRDGGGPAPVVVIAHGFAGSRQLMEAFAFSLAHAGYTVVSYDLEGHGRNPVPMSGDVTSIDGTTRLLVEEAQRVAREALSHPRADGRLVYLGHSMASDIAVRAALADPPADAVVGISMFSQAVTADAPRNLLVIAGEWEGRLAAEALTALRLADPTLDLGMTAGDPSDGTGRRALLAPSVEHVGVLYSATALRETRDWLDRVFGMGAGGVQAEAPSLSDMAARDVAARGGWIALLLAAVITLGWPLAKLLPAPLGHAHSRARVLGSVAGLGKGLQRAGANGSKPTLGLSIGLQSGIMGSENAVHPLTTRQFWVLITVPTLAVPIILAPVKVQFLPVLVADYLALHLGLFGCVWLGMLWYFGAFRQVFSPRALWIAAAVGLYGIVVFGSILDRYVTSFAPHSGRMTIILGLALGSVPFMLADALVTDGGRAPLWRVLLARFAFLTSLGLAVMLDFEGLFFLIIILPVILLFFVLFGSMAGWVGRRTHLPAAAGIGLGFILAWALGVSFPMFDATL